MTRRRILMAVYNPIEVDGRVKRTAESLAAEYDLTLLCPQGSGAFSTSLYQINRLAQRPDSGRMTRLLSFWRALIALAWRIRPDAVYAHDFFLPLPGWIAARLARARFIYDAHELIVPAKAEQLTPRSWLFYRLERLVVGRADLVIAANPERAEAMRKHYHLPNAPLSVGNVPPAPTRLLSDAEVLERYPAVSRAAPGDVHVVYMGDINLERGLGVLVDAGALLPDKFKLVFVGAGPHLEEVRALASGELKDRLKVVGPVPHAHVHDVIRLADIGYVSYSMNGLNNLLCAPNKVFEYAQAGLPMVATCQQTIRRMFAEHPIGQLVGCSGAVSARDVAGAIEDLARNVADYRRALPSFVSANTWPMESAKLVQSMRRALA